MEQGPNTMHQASSKDAGYSSDASSHLNYVDASSGRISNVGSFSRGSLSLSHGGSNVNVLDEMVGAGGRHSSLGRSGRCLSGRNSGSLSRDAGDRILRSISRPRDSALGDIDSSAIAQVGDSGDRVMMYDRDGDKGSIQLSIDEARAVENGFGPGAHLRSSFSPVTPVAEEIRSPLPTDAILYSTNKDHIHKVQDSSIKVNDYKLPRRVDHIVYLIHLALFGILGVLTRYLLQKLFGPSVLALVGDNTPLYIDLPSNMLGSFLMGWFGIAFKADIRNISEHLAIGLSTGYLGSVTTFSGWNQKMLNLAAKGHWAFAVGGILLGMLIVNECIRVGVESAEGIRKSFSNNVSQNPVSTGCSFDCWRVDSLNRHMMVMTIMLLLLASLWGLSGALAGMKLDNATDGAILWLGCLVGPPGVWIRWYLARLNGQGLGQKQLLQWLPIGTLAANLLAASLMAALSTISKAVNTRRCTVLVSGIQLGFLGCMSTVSTFVSEVYAMRETGHSGRALAYVLATIFPSFAIGTLIYSVPVWSKHYK